MLPEPRSLAASLLALAAALPAFGAGEPPAEQLPAPGTPLPPVARAETNFKIGERYLESLPDGTVVRVERTDGTRLEYRLEEGRWKTELPPARLEQDGSRFVSPLGYSVAITRVRNRERVRITAPSGAYTDFWISGDRLLASEGDGGLWSLSISHGGALRLPDATRIDLLPRKARWEAITLAGRRFALDLRSGRWSELPAVPSAPLVPDLNAAYVAGDGDDWRRPVAEEHVAFAWNWYPYGLPASRLAADLRDPKRKHDLDFYFNGLREAQPGPEAAAYLFARRFCLGGGDKLTFDVPGREPYTAMLLPGPIEPDFFLLKIERPKTLPAPRSIPQGRR
ncbi:MAG: hypothetical protein D6718_07575 [Acidobacteria bacterium]|nr:MAG: hypothetical protein D6718_07575 [Acidobacteriota bacterium]